MQWSYSHSSDHSFNHLSVLRRLTRTSVSGVGQRTHELLRQELGARQGNNSLTQQHSTLTPDSKDNSGFHLGIVSSLLFRLSIPPHLLFVVHPCT